MKKTTVGIIFGGRSVEHEISIKSARCIVESIDREKYNIILIPVDQDGRWSLQRNPDYLSQEARLKRIVHKEEDENLIFDTLRMPHPLRTASSDQPVAVDVVFPVIHGTYGEDGTLQGLLKQMQIPFVGADVLGSAVGMDKDVMKRLLQDAGLKVANWISAHHSYANEIDFNEVSARLGNPLFIKPASLGSSVGISKVDNPVDFKDAVALAFQYDGKILFEESINGREIECSVLGNERPIASLPGEIVFAEEFYSYKAKYIDEDGALLDIPAPLSDSMIEEIQTAAIRVFKALCCEGMARVDFFIKKNSNEIIVNEINTIPGFTSISMYPKLWEKTGIPIKELIDRLIQLALDRHARTLELQHSVF